MNTLTIRKSPLVLIRNIIVFESIYFFFDIVVAVSYGAYANNEFVGPNFKFIIFLIGIGIILQIVLFASWYLSYFLIEQNQIFIRSGFLFKRTRTIMKEKDFAYERNQGPIAKLLKYETVRIIFANKTISFDDVSEGSVDNILANVRLERKSEELEDIKDKEVEKLIKQGENSQIEFKSTLRWDVVQDKTNKSLEWAVLKNIIAFLNSSGGTLLIGVEDNGDIFGLEKDFKSLPKKNQDGFENHLMQLFKKDIGPDLLHLIAISFKVINDKTICRVDVGNSSKPIFIKHNDQELFIIKTGNSVSNLEISEAIKYIESNF